MRAADMESLASAAGGAEADTAYPRAHRLPRFNFASRPVSVDLVAASTDDRVIAALIPVLVFLGGLLLQFGLAHKAEVAAEQLRSQLVLEQPSVLRVQTLGQAYAAARAQYLADQQTRLSGPLLARSMAQWMNRISPDVTLSQVTISNGGAGVTISGEGPSLDALRAGVIASFGASCSKKHAPLPLDCVPVASASFSRNSKGREGYTVSTVDASSPTPSPFPAPAGIGSTNSSASASQQTP